MAGCPCGLVRARRNRSGARRGCDSVLDSAQEALAFFVTAALAGALRAWAVRDPGSGVRRRVANGVAVAWVIAAAWIGVLLLIYQAASRPPPGPEATYLGLTATVYHLVALYGGAVLVTLAALVPSAEVVRRRQSAT